MHKIILGLSAVALLAGCSVKSDTWVNKAGRVEVKGDVFTDTFETRQLNTGMMHAIANQYVRFGNGPLSLVVSYDPQSKVNTGLLAQENVSLIQGFLHKNGIVDIRSIISPMQGSGDISTTLISFPAITASAPTGCGMMPGYNDPSENIPDNATEDPTYGYGCTVETLMAKQISKPSDLMGRQGVEKLGDGRRAERVITGRGYYSDKPLPKIEGEAASKQ